MRNRKLPFRAVLLGAMVLSSLALTASLVWSVPGVSAAGAANSEAGELVRLINGERAALGKAPLRLDSYLATKARDGAVACPDDATRVMAGRAKDFAVFGFGKNAHQLRLCPSYTSMDAMKEWGYAGGRGEIAALNGGYGTSKVSYRYGCTPSLRTCPGGTTSSYATTARAMTNWTSSPTHYDIIVGKYDRVGCGAWIGSNGAFFYDCMFSMGGRVAPTVRSTPAPTAAGPAPTAATRQNAAAGSGTQSAATPTGTPAAVATGTPLGTAGATPSTTPPLATTPPATPTAPPATPAPAALPATDTAKGGSQSDPPGGNASAATSRDLGVAAGAMAVFISLGYALLLSWRRRRQVRRAA